MPTSCVAYGCSNHNMMENKPGFFRFPNGEKNSELRKRWVNACRRKNSDGTPWNPAGNNVYICGAHFISGKPNRKDPLHPDHVPSLFAFSNTSEVENGKKVRRYNNMMKRRRILGESNSSNSSEHSVHQEPDIPVDHSKEDPVQEEEETVEENNSGEVSFLSPPPPPSRVPCCQTPILNNSSLVIELEKLRLEKDSALKKTKALEIEVINLRKERDTALETVKELKSKFTSYANLRKCLPDKFKFYTGISLEIFDNIFDYLSKRLQPCKSKIQYKTQMLMTLVKLRLNIPFEYLADNFGVAKSTCNDIFKRWIHLMFIKLQPLIKWPDHDASLRTLPHVFRQYFPRLTGIIDCTEFFIDRPKNLEARAQVYSNYKKHSTIKFLIACTAHGSISFISKAWGGRVSDVELVKNSGFISSKYHHPGDQILADRGFTLEDEFAAGCGVELVIPAFTKGKNQLSAREVEVTRQIAAIRIHIERVIGLLKNRYRILDGTLSTTLVKALSDESNETDYTSIDKLITVCAALCNLGDGIVYKDDNHTPPIIPTNPSNNTNEDTNQ